MQSKTYEPVSSSQYYKDIVDEWPPFLKAEEDEFRRKMIEEGRYKEMKDELVLRNVGLISIYGKSWTRIYSPDDAVSIGITGLYEAARVFDWNRTDVRFGTFAGWYIKKVFNKNKDNYFSRVDEESLRWDKTVDGDSCDEGDGSCCLGDFVCQDIDPEYLTIKNDPDALCPTNVEAWLEEKIRVGFAEKRKYARHSAAESDKLSLEKYLFLAKLKLDNPSMILDEQAVELSKKFNIGKAYSRERIRQMQAKNNAYMVAGIRAELSAKYKAIRPKISDFPGGCEEKKNRLVWNQNTKTYDIEEYVEKNTYGTNWPAFHTALAKFDKFIDMKADDYLSDMFHVKFDGLKPVRIGRKLSKIEKRYDFIRENVNWHRTGSC